VCGVFGAALPKGSGTEAANVAALGLFALQHRGQESAGLAVSDGAELFLYKDLGMISSVLDERRLPSFHGDLAIAHCRYSTTGSTVWENAQPTLRLGPRRAVAIGHNGNLVNTRELLGELRGGRGRLPASTDTELLTALLADEPGQDTVEALMSLLPRVRGAYTLVILDRDRIIGVRDPHGFRPLCIGRIPDVASPVHAPGGLWGDEETADEPRHAWVLSSETTSRPARSPARSASPRRHRHSASSSSSTSLAPTPTSRAGACTRPAAGWGSSWRWSTRPTRT
jgi:amidophosphoribosyltransferase